jgi:hypothetical protein
MISALFLLLTASISTLLQLDMLNWLYVPGNETYTIIFYLGIILKHMIALVLILPLFFISTAFQLISLEELHTAGGLRNRLKREGLLSET